MTKKDIAIFGGTFNPVHNGHIDIIKYLIDNYIVDEVWVLPSYYSPHKYIKLFDSFDSRLDMLKIATKNINNVFINQVEKEYYNIYKDKTYTYEVLEYLKQKFMNCRFHFVVGFDSIKNIKSWHKYQELLRDYWFYIFDRIDNEFITYEQKTYYLNNLGKNININFIYEFFDINITNVSSTNLRLLLMNYEKNYNELSKLMDKDVLNYIKENKLYGVC